MPQINRANRANRVAPVINAPTMPGIEASWSLMDFMSIHGKMKYCPNMVNKETGEEFNSLACVNDEGTVTFVHFSQNLGELSPAQIKAQASQLQVCKLSSGTYSLCAQGSNAWEDIF